VVLRALYRWQPTSTMNLLRTVPVVLMLAAAVLGDVEFLVPAPDSVARGGDVLTAHWRDSGKSPRLSELTQYDLFLCAGGDPTHSHVCKISSTTLGELNRFSNLTSARGFRQIWPFSSRQGPLHEGTRFRSKSIVILGATTAMHSMYLT
jgi:hypothetical protein